MELQSLAEPKVLVLDTLATLRLGSGLQLPRGLESRFPTKSESASERSCRTLSGSGSVSEPQMGYCSASPVSSG